MFLFLYKSRLKCLLRDKDIVFWTLLFPLLLATLFHIAFGSIMNRSEGFSPIVTAVVDNSAYQSNTAFREVLTAVSTGDEPLLKLSVLSESEAKQRLKDGEISGVITVTDSITLKVRESGINESVLKAFLDEYLQTQKTVTSILATNPSAATQGLFDDLANRKNYTEEITLSGASPDPTVNYFYALIAMTCLYGSFWGMRNTNDIQANLSDLGARRCAAPTHKLTSVLSDSLASLTIQFAEILVTLCYLVFVLGVDFGTRWGYVVLTCLVGSALGISLGSFIGSAFKKDESLKTGILIGFSMLMSFLAGLMFGNMKYIIAQKAPLLGLINPAALITDSFYSLYVYETLSRYFLNMGILCAITVLLVFLSYLFVRRQRYASL